MERETHFAAYGSFAAVYDLFMDNIPYGEWAQYIRSLLREQKIEDGLVLELGRGNAGGEGHLCLRAGQNEGISGFPVYLHLHGLL